MNRPTLLIASRQPATAFALYQAINLFLPNSELPHHIKHIGFNCSAELFEVLDELSPSQLLNTMLLFDAGAENENTWDVMQMNRDNGLAAQLVLSYPEVFFVFIGATGRINSPTWDKNKDLLHDHENINRIVEAHHFVLDNNLIDIFKLIRLHAQGFRTLFDATGLRSLLKLDLQQQLRVIISDMCAGIYHSFSIKRLNLPALVAEDEAQFLYLNSYATYKFGCRAWLAHTNKEFLRLTEGASEPAHISAPLNFTTALIDWDLAYSDDESLDKKTRQKVRWEFLESRRVEHPVIITSFPQSFSKPTKIQKTINKVRSWWPWNYAAPLSRDRLPGNSVVLPKPYGGFFDLLQKRTNEPEDNILKLEFQRVHQTMIADMAETYELRAEEAARRSGDASDAEKAPMTHSAPYSCSVVAGRLLQRAQKLKSDDALDTEQWVQMSLLACEAKEILGGLSLSTTYQALALQNEAEVRAEISFIGMAAEIKVGQRLTDLAKEVELVQKAAMGGNRKNEDYQDVAGRLNCLLVTSHNLRMRFTEGEQMKAAECCLREFAEYHHRLRLLPFTLRLGKRSGAFMNSVLKPIVGYPEFVTQAGTSVARLFGASLFWILCFFVLYFALFSIHPQLKDDLQKPALWAAGHSLFTFIELQPGTSEAEGLKTEQAGGQKGEQQVGQKNEVSTQPSARAGVLSHTAWLLCYWALLLAELVLAYIHLGLFVSVMYRHITKRAP